jgi:hypothetical protein
MAFSIGNTAHNTALVSGSGNTMTISVNAGSVILVPVFLTSTSAPVIHVVSITSPDLTFAARAIKTEQDTGSSTLACGSEVWWAYSSGGLTNEVITLNISGSPSFSGFCGAIECRGLPNTSNPWDANGSLPAENTGTGSSGTVTGVSTNSGTPIGLVYTSTSGPAHAVPTSPGTWTAADQSEGAGGNSRFVVYYQVFSSAQSNATWSASVNTNNWTFMGDAFANVIVTNTFGGVMGL